MQSKSISSPVKDPRPLSNYDELLLQHSLLFSDGLKELRNVKEQLYSAAEHFEDSYHKNDNKQRLLESLKDYISKSLIKTIDHLGSVTYKVNKFLDESVSDVSRTTLRVLCIEQRLRTCQVYANYGMISQQSLLIQTPKYQKHFLLPESCISEGVKDKAQSSGLRLSNSISFSFTKAASHKILEKRSRSISPLQFPTKRSGSFIHRSISPNSSSRRQQQSTEAWRSRSLYPRRQSTKEIQVYSKKTINLFKALFNIYKSKNDNNRCFT